MRKIIVIILVIFIGFGGCQQQKKARPLNKNQLNILSYFPENTGYLMYANIEELRNTGFWKTYFKANRESRIVQLSNNFEKISGLSLANDIKQIYIGGTWKGTKIIGILIDNNLPKVLKHFEKDKDFSSKKIGSKNIFRLKKKKSLEFYFPNKSLLLIVNNEKYLARLINKVHKSVKDNKSFLSTINDIRHKNYFWMATDRGIYAINYFKKTLGIRKGIPHKDLLKKVENMTFSAGFDDNVTLESTWKISGHKSAYLLTAAIQGAITMNLLSVDNYELGKMLKKTRIQQYDTMLNFKLNLNDKDVLMLKKLADKQKISLKL